MTIKQIVGLEASSSDTQSFGSIQEIPYGDKIIICRQADSKQTGPYVIVPGFKASDPYETTHKISAIRVEIIPKEEQPEVEQVVNSQLKGPVHFWT